MHLKHLNGNKNYIIENNADQASAPDVFKHGKLYWPEDYTGILLASFSYQRESEMFPYKNTLKVILRKRKENRILL